MGKTKNQSREIIDGLKLSKQVLEKPIKKSTGKFLEFLMKNLNQ
jgi:hypothetical protein